MWDGFLYTFSGIFGLIGFFLTTYTTIRRFRQNERKFKELLPDHKGFVRFPPTFQILSLPKPRSEKENEYLYYQRKHLFESAKIFVIAFGFWRLAYFADQLH